MEELRLWLRWIEDESDVAAGIELKLPLAMRLLPGLGNSLGPLGTLVCSRTVLLRRWLKLCRDSTGTRVAEAGKEGFRKVISPGCSFSIEVRGILRRACDSDSVLESSGTADRSRSSVYASARVRGWRRVATSITVRRACAAGHDGPAHNSTDAAMISRINHRSCEGGAALVVPARTVPPFL